MYARCLSLLSIFAIMFCPAGLAMGQIRSGDRRPNIILIVADDLGFSDLGCYGSEIFTPNIDRLARDGLRFTQFYNAGRGCPSRAALMTGLYPHQTGMGLMMKDYKKPGYRGNLNKSCATIAELLKTAGYQTLMCGKWSLTRHTGPLGPKHTWPQNRGFDHFHGTLGGAGSYFNPSTLIRENRAVRAPGNYYYTDAMSQQAVAYVAQATRSKKPFFLCVSYTAPHWPLHAKPETIARYRGKYATGWDSLRRERHRRMVSQGIVKAQWPLSPREPTVRSWEQNNYKPWQQKRMEVYAAQVDSMDRGVGLILDKLKQTGAENNTLVMFLSDNGACAEEVSSKWKGTHVPTKTRDGRAVYSGNNPNVSPGAEETYQSYGIAWANASNTPFRSYKHWMHEGGIATPMIARWPDGIAQRGKLTHQPGHVIDVMATCLEVAKLQYPTITGGLRILPIEGKSLLPILQGKTRQPSVLFWEHEGNRAVRDGKWKLVSRYPGKWELYDMEADRTELNDMAKRFPVIVADLSGAYAVWAERCNVEQWRK